jgi:hemerythrin-like metal-binding protein
MSNAPLIAWSPNYRIGVPAVDHEHEELVGLINALYAELEADAAKYTILDFLGEIYARISAHFALEEKKMRDYAYDRYPQHKREHERLLDEIADIIDLYEDDGSFDRQALAGRMNEWFSVHFRTEDARLHQHLG